MGPIFQVFVVSSLSTNITEGHPIDAYVTELFGRVDKRRSGEG